MTDDLEIFERAFASGCGGIVRTCACGRTFFDDDDSNSWEDGELEELRKKAAALVATATDHTVGTIVVEGVDYCSDCDCWHERARNIQRFLWGNRYGIAKWYELTKRDRERIAESVPEVDFE